MFFVLWIFALKPQNLFRYEGERTLKSFPKFRKACIQCMENKYGFVIQGLIRRFSSI